MFAHRQIKNILVKKGLSAQEKMCKIINCIRNSFSAIKLIYVSFHICSQNENYVMIQ